MDFLLDEKRQQLRELRIDQVSVSKAEKWWTGDPIPGTPTDLAAFLGLPRSDTIRIFVQDRVLCDAVHRQAVDQVAAEYRAYREALFAPSLYRILPLEDQPRSYKPTDELDSFSVCSYGTNPAETIWMCPAGWLDSNPKDFWSVNRSEIDPARRLDCWYYRDRFRYLRHELEHWGTPLFGDLFSVAEERAQRKPLPERPARDALKWLSSAQINENLHAIAHARIRDWGQMGRDVPLETGDFLVSMLGFTEVKLARYDGPPNDATRSLYLLRASPKIMRSERDSSTVWFALTCDDFTDQIRMLLSDRVMKPLTLSFPLNALRLPPLHGGVTAGMAFVLDSLTRLALGGESVAELNANLRRVEESLMADDVPWPGKWSCLHLIARYRTTERTMRKVIVLCNDPVIGRECVDGLKKRRIPAADPRLFSVTQQGLEPSLASEVAAAAAVVSVTSAVAPLASVSEQLGATHALDIAGESHVFALYAGQGEAREFPARQFLEHLFSETNQEPVSVDLTSSKIDQLLERVRQLQQNPVAAACDEIIDRLAQLDSPAEPFVRLAPRGPRVSLLDRVRPALTALSGRLKANRVIPRGEAPHITPSPKRRKLHDFGMFVTHNDGLARKINELKAIYLQALQLTENKQSQVISLLIEGETGCGKDALVDYLDTLQPRTRFVRFGVTVDARFILSQLFGHAKGAYTGAAKERSGIFGTATKESSPVFLNEINSYPPEVQFRLLTVIERGQFARLGEEEEKASEYRGVVVAASNKPLSAMVAEGSFRLDLQMRLGSPIVIPPLRERPEDIDCIFDKITSTLAKNVHGRQITLALDPSARKLLLDYAWPGNARELQGLVMRARLLDQSVIDAGFIEQNFPGICSREPRDGTSAANHLTTVVPHELRSLEDILATPGLTRKQQYTQLMEQTKAKSPRTNELPDWVRSREKLIRQFKAILPRANDYLEVLNAKRTR